MESPPDSTMVIRMRKDFDAFLSGSGKRMEEPSFRLDLNVEAKPSSKSHPPVTTENIKNVLEREKQEKMRTAELLALQGKIAQLEMQLTSTKTSNKRARIEYEKDIDSIKYERERESERVSELHNKIRRLAESEQSAKEEMADSQQQWKTARMSLEGKLRTVQREKLALEEKIEKTKEDSQQEIMELKQESGRCLTELQLIVIELEETKEQLKSQNKRVEELTEQMSTFEETKEKAQAAEEKVKDLEEEINRQAEDAAVTRALRADIEKLPALEKEVSRLRTENEYLNQEKQNTLLLQEQLTSVQKKLEMTEKRYETFTQLQMEHEELKSRLQRWEAEDTSGSRRPQSPSELLRRVRELQAAEVVALEEKGNLQSSISLLEVRLREAKEQLEKSQKELANQQLQTQQSSDFIKRLQRKLLLVTKERDCYKRILDSYENEMTINIQTDSRVKDLEAVVEGYQQHNKELETQLENMAQAQQTMSARCLELEHQCRSVQTGSSALGKAKEDRTGQLQERVLELEETLGKVTEEKEILEARIEQRQLQGDYDPTKMKVVHMTMNPSAIAQQQRQKEMDRLREENERLTTRVQLLEQAGGPVEDLTLQVDQQLESVPESRVIEDLKAQLAKEELRRQRLVEAFKKTSQEFRETCYQLLGYKIDLPSTGQYRLASMYSNSPHDYFLFKQGQSGEIQMLETDFSGRQQDKLEMYLQNRDSIPALLSAITLDLFNQQTINMG